LSIAKVERVRWKSWKERKELEKSGKTESKFKKTMPYLPQLNLHQNNQKIVFLWCFEAFRQLKINPKRYTKAHE
jgi:hypothetical protein